MGKYVPLNGGGKNTEIDNICSFYCLEFLTAYKYYMIIKGKSEKAEMQQQQKKGTKSFLSRRDSHLELSSVSL